MFVQVIRGRTGDASALQARLDEWHNQLAPDAIGWQGTTAGVAEDGTFVAMVQFESAEAARRNSERPEQGEWWAKTEALIDDAQFIDADEVFTMFGGANPKAQFVQIMESEVHDLDKAKSFMAEAEQHLPEHRPDVIGGLIAAHGDKLTQAMFFTDEASARAAESQPPPPEMDEQMQQMATVFGDTTYIDLHSPWVAQA